MVNLDKNMSPEGDCVQGTAVTKLCDGLVCVLDQTPFGGIGDIHIGCSRGQKCSRSEGLLVAERCPSGSPGCSQSLCRWTPRPGRQGQPALARSPATFASSWFIWCRRSDRGGSRSRGLRPGVERLEQRRSCRPSRLLRGLSSEPVQGMPNNNYSEIHLNSYQTDTLSVPGPPASHTRRCSRS